VADRGSIGVDRTFVGHVPLPGWALDARKLHEIDRTGTFAGVVAVGGVPLEDGLVRLYYRPNGILIDATRSGAAGVFSFGGLEVGIGAYYVVAFDPDGGTIYNAQILDRIAPV